ncbi:MAG: Ig-like domain repeat protein, partial [Thermoplasmata archaeon]|nr:Ig-like domain repeat protein [Thermoplasmata archaeon]
TPGQYQFLVRVRSVTNGYVTATAIATINVTAYGAHVAVTPYLVTVDPGQVASYQVTVNNTGLVRTTFDLRSAVVFANFSQPNVTLDPGQSVTVTMTVEGNTTGFLPFGIHNMGVMAIPQPEPSVYGLAWAKVDINKAEGLSMTVEPSLLTMAKPDLTDGYTITVTNTGNIGQDVVFEAVMDPSIDWKFSFDNTHVGALMDKPLFLFVTPSTEGTFNVTIRVICLTNASLTTYVNVTLQVGFRQTNLTLNDASAVYTDAGTVLFTIFDERDETLLYPPHEFIIEYYNEGTWHDLLGEKFTLSSGSDVNVSFSAPNIKPGDYSLRVRYLGTSRYNASEHIAILHLLKETPVPTPTDTTVQYTDRTSIQYRVLDDDGQTVPVDITLLHLEYKAPDGTWRDLGASFIGTSANEGTATFLAPDEPAGSYEMRLMHTGDDFYDTGSGNGTIDVIAEVTGVTYTGDTEGPYGGSATFSAYLEDADNGTAIAGATVNFTINGVTYTATTNATGIATVTVTLTAPPGTYQLTVNYDGNGSCKASSDAITFIVRD